MVDVDGVIPIANDADADFSDQCRTEDMRVIDPWALVARGAAALKAAVMRTAIDAAVRPIQAGIEHAGPLEAVPNEQPVAGSGDIIHLDIELIDRLAL